MLLTATSMRPSFSTSAAATPRPFSDSAARDGGHGAAERSPSGLPAGSRAGARARHRPRGFVIGIAPAASTRSSLPLFARSTAGAPQPAKLEPSAGRNAGRAFANAGAPGFASRTYAATARGGSSSRTDRPPVAVVVGGDDAHARRTGRRRPPRPRAPRSGSRDPAGIGLHAAGPRHVLVQLVRILVVRDVEIRPPVAVVVREDRAEAVREVRRLEPRLDADLAEARAAVRPVALVEDRAGRARRRRSSGSPRSIPGPGRRDPCSRR